MCGWAAGVSRVTGFSVDRRMVPGSDKLLGVGDSPGKVITVIIISRDDCPRREVFSRNDRLQGET